MTKTSKTILFFGNERLATGVSTTAPTLQALLKAGYRVPAVISNFERGHSRSARELEIAAVAEAHRIPVLYPGRPGDILSELKSFQAVAAVLVAYGRIVPQVVIDIFPKGIVNIHPSLLPKHRGPTPIESVILDGSRETGVSIMQLSADMDAGPVFGQATIELQGTETKQELADQLLKLGGELLLDHLPDILERTAVARPQDHQKATYDRLLTKQDGLIDWQKPADQLAREVRAYAEWPKSRTTIGGKEVIILKAQVVEQSGPAGKAEAQGKDLVVFCGQNALKILELKPAGKQKMTGEAFIAGHKQLL